MIDSCFEFMSDLFDGYCRCVPAKLLLCLCIEIDNDGLDTIIDVFNCSPSTRSSSGSRRGRNAKAFCATEIQRDQYACNKEHPSDELYCWMHSFAFKSSAELSHTKKRKARSFGWKVVSARRLRAAPQTSLPQGHTLRPRTGCQQTAAVKSSQQRPNSRVSADIIEGR